MTLKHQVYFEATGWLKHVLELVESCEARDQMWQLGGRRRAKFMNKAKPYIKRIVCRHPLVEGFTHYRIERTGSNNLYDVEARRKQSFRVYLFKNEVNNDR